MEPMPIYITPDNRSGENLDDVSDHTIRGRRKEGATLLDFLHVGNGEICAIVLKGDGTLTTRGLRQIRPHYPNE